MTYYTVLKFVIGDFENRELFNGLKMYPLNKILTNYKDAERFCKDEIGDRKYITDNHSDNKQEDELYFDIFSLCEVNNTEKIYFLPHHNTMYAIVRYIDFYGQE